MKHYKVIALSVGGRANRIFTAGETVTDDDFIPGRANELVEKGFLSFEGETDTIVRERQDDVEVEVKQTETPVIVADIKNSLGDGIDSITRKEIIKQLSELGVPFEQSASKKELFDIWLNRGNY